MKTTPALPVGSRDQGLSGQDLFDTHSLPPKRTAAVGACNAIKRLRTDGFLTMAPNKLLRLTDQGREAAERMLERHAILKRCLVVMGVDPDTAQEDACRMEHAVSPETVERMRRFVLQDRGSAA